MDLASKLGLDEQGLPVQEDRKKLHLYINLVLAASGQPPCGLSDETDLIETAQNLLQSYREKQRLLSSYLCPADQRIQNFLNRYLGEAGVENIPELPTLTFILDRYGIARELSLPVDSDEFRSDIVSSFRVAQGVLHNPASDRRTTKGSFHIADGGLPIPGDKKTVPRKAFAYMLEKALQPPDELMLLPFSANQEKPSRMFVSLLLRPTVCPEVPGVEAEKNMEIRFFAPGNLVSNLDFVESIFGNGGNPNLAEYDAALDVEHWTGHTGCVILAPHLVTLTKKEIGLPHWDEATEQQRAQGMCWKDEEERYNDGQAFKITARDTSGVIVTILADNYYGYCKKEVKTQIGYSANLYGLAEEEHAGGALAFKRRNHGEEYGVDSQTRQRGFGFNEVSRRYGEIMDVKPEGYGIDRKYPNIYYMPQDLRMNLNKQSISWWDNGEKHQIRLQPGIIYMQPNGYKIEMKKHPGAPSWRLVGTEPEGTFCHKPSTVSGGGKSEISKSLNDAVIYGPMFVDNLETDLDRVQEIFDYDYSKRLKPEFEHLDRDPSRQPLDPDRSLGSFIKLLIPSEYCHDAHNEWVRSIPPRIQALAFLVKRFYREEWGNDWRSHLSVDEIDGHPGHELKLNDRHIVGSYLRVGFDTDNKWRTFKFRQDFIPSEKIQMEDDISASVVVPAKSINHCSTDGNPDASVKLVTNCEYRLFQRPDDAVIPGYDKQTEKDMAGKSNFVANYEPLKGDNLAEIVNDVFTFEQFTDPMRKLLKKAHKKGDRYVISSAHPRLMEGKPSKNPRYLQIRTDLVDPVRKYAATMGMRLQRKLPLDQPVCTPVDAVLAGRRNNPPEPGIRPLAVYNPIHYQDLPELFMDFICSLTGKSPSTTGAGSEGALTKGPFNALRPTADLNNALVSYILSGYAGFSSSAGYIGPNMKVEHDISLLVPEIWTRLKPKERDPRFLIDHDYLEPLEDFEHKGEKVLASRLGYRITARFVRDFMGRMFDNPDMVFTDEILMPEMQDIDCFVDGVNNIVEAQQKVAQRYLDDGSVEDACPPLRALIHIMAQGHYQGKTVHDPEIRHMFTREYLLESDWYRERLEVKQQREIKLWGDHIRNLEDFLCKPQYAEVAERMALQGRLECARGKLREVESDEYLDSLIGTIGADPLAPAREVQQQAHLHQKIA